MANKELRKLNREQLLQIMVEQSRRINSLEAENKQLRNELRYRMIEVKKIGSIAQASLRLNHVFQEAHMASEQYLESISLWDERTVEE